MRKSVVVLAAVACVLLPIAAYAAIPDSAGVIHGCRNNLLHTVTVVDAPSQTCPAGTTALNWNQTGPQGPAGPQGTVGATGPGSTIYSVRASFGVHAGDTSAGGEAVCASSSDMVLAGGYGFSLFTTQVGPAPGAPTHISADFAEPVIPHLGASQRFQVHVTFDPYVTSFYGASFDVWATCLTTNP